MPCPGPIILPINGITGGSNSKPKKPAPRPHGSPDGIPVIDFDVVRPLWTGTPQRPSFTEPVDTRTDAEILSQIKDEEHWECLKYVGPLRFVLGLDCQGFGPDPDECGLGRILLAGSFEIFLSAGGLVEATPIELADLGLLEEQGLLRSTRNSIIKSQVRRILKRMRTQSGTRAQQWQRHVIPSGLQRRAEQLIVVQEKLGDKLQLYILDLSAPANADGSLAIAPFEDEAYDALLDAWEDAAPERAQANANARILEKLRRDGHH